MDLDLSDEQVMLRDACEALLTRHSSINEPPDPLSLWSRLVEFGVVGDDGEPNDEATGFGLVDWCLLTRSLGSHLAVAPTGGAAVLHALDRYAGLGGQLSRMLDFGAPVAVAVLEPGNDWDQIATTAFVAGPGGAWVVSGEKAFVALPAIAAEILVVGRVEGAPAIALIPAAAHGVAITEQPTLDERVSFGRLTLTDVEVDPSRVVYGEDGVRAVSLLRSVGAVLAGSEAVGAAAQLTEIAREYATQRKQFGHAIGSYQAVAHILAEMYVLVETAWSTVLYAAANLDEAPSEGDDQDQTAAIAKAYASRATREVAHGALQVLGGIAFTAEHPAHRYLRRILVCCEQFGDAGYHERQLGAQLSDPARRPVVLSSNESVR